MKKTKVTNQSFLLSVNQMMNVSCSSTVIVCGVVLKEPKRDKDNYPLGLYYTSWNTEAFKPFKGTITLSN